MKFTVAATAAFAAGALAGYSNETTSTYTTVIPTVVTEFTTYCPEETTLTHGNKTYTVTGPTTLTITDCPCTLDKTVTTTTVCPVTSETVTKSSSTPVIPTATGAAGKVVPGALAGAVAVAAYLL